MKYDIKLLKENFDNFLKESLVDVPNPVNMNQKSPQMKKIKSDGKYDYWVGTDEAGKPFYNITPIGQYKGGTDSPYSGYHDANWISKAKGVPNIFQSENDLNEKLIIKKYSPENLLVVMSDREDAKGRGAETYKAKDALKKAGFKWKTLTAPDGKQVSAWAISADLARKAQDTINAINKEKPEVRPDGSQVTGDQQKFEELVFDLSTISKKSGLDQKIIAFLDTLKKEADSARADEAFQKYINFAKKFRKYSFANTMLIWIQKPDATHVAGFKKWKELNRQVKKGAKAISIFVPKMRKVAAKDGDGTSSNSDTTRQPDPNIEKDLDKQIQKQVLTGFQIGYIFDISDTEVIPGMEDKAAEPPSWHAGDEPSEVADKLAGYVEDIIKSVGIKYTRDAAKGGEMGYARGGEHINITSGVAGANRASVLIHELAHTLMHFPNSIFSDDEQKTIPKAVKEYQAEAVAAAVLDEYGIPFKHSATYVALWNEKIPELAEYTNMILKAARYIIHEIDVRAESDENKQPA